MPKAGLIVGAGSKEETLLARTMRAVAEIITFSAQNDAEPRAVVVGPERDIMLWMGDSEFPSWALTSQENPPFAGPAAAIAAGMKALPNTADYVMILACDMPHAPLLAAQLAEGFEKCAPEEGIMAKDSGKLQPLAGIYPRAQLQRVLDEAAAAHRLNNASVFSVLDSVKTIECIVPPGTTADIDTWQDAQEQGISAAQ